MAMDVGGSDLSDQMMAAPAFSDNGFPSGAPFKRRRAEEQEIRSIGGVEVLRRFSAPAPPVSKSFVVIRPSNGVFHSEAFRGDSTLFVPLPEHETTGEFLINVRTVEQISFCNGQFSIGNEMMRFSRKAEGYVMLLWRYSESRNRLFIFDSFLFTDINEFHRVQAALSQLCF